jgi:hypothetical protein
MDNGKSDFSLNSDTYFSGAELFMASESPCIKWERSLTCTALGCESVVDE